METEGSPHPLPAPGLAPNPDLRMESKCMALQGLGRQEAQVALGKKQERQGFLSQSWGGVSAGALSTRELELGLGRNCPPRTSMTLDSEISCAPEREVGRGPVSKKRLFILE